MKILSIGAFSKISNTSLHRTWALRKNADDVDMIETDRYGNYHATNEGGYITWYDFACEIFKQAGIQIDVTPVPSSSYPSKAKRPFNSRLSKRKLIENGFELLLDYLSIPNAEDLFATHARSFAMSIVDATQMRNQVLYGEWSSKWKAVINAVGSLDDVDDFGQAIFGTSDNYQRGIQVCEKHS